MIKKKRVRYKKRVFEIEDSFISHKSFNLPKLWFRNYLVINLSKLTLPGPVSSKVKKTIRNSPAASPFPKKSPPMAENNATDMAITSGMQARRVNKPSITNAAQKNSAKTTRANDVVEPMWKGSENFGAI